MVDAIVRGFLGEWGQALLDAYLKYSLYINAILLIYAAAIVLARRNYHLILNSLLKTLEGQYQAQVSNKNRKQIEALLRKRTIPWEQARKASRYPFLTSSKGISLHVKTDKTLQRLFSIETLSYHLEQQQKERSTT